jgi:hypothetical protein
MAGIKGSYRVACVEVQSRDQQGVTNISVLKPRRIKHQLDCSASGPQQRLVCLGLNQRPHQGRGAVGGALLGNKKQRGYATAVSSLRLDVDVSTGGYQGRDNAVAELLFLPESK